ncbi:hypothetical protein NQ317_002186 [Molorchus minor]|uniref:Uncharacterized protein n=1 Tax=Molorchus minor TaxID=1323400 RepID=A0ABQ9IYH7_9CUCU|nr:hypothetical protein NQ317_002186 [Molorchus minor]
MATPSLHTMVRIFNSQFKISRQHAPSTNGISSIKFRSSSPHSSAVANIYCGPEYKENTVITGYLGSKAIRMTPSLLRVRVWICGIAILAVVESREPSKIVTVDRLRWDFLNVEESLWDYVLDYLDNNIKEHETGELYLIKEFEKFGNAITKAFPNDLTFGLGDLDSVWSVQLAYADLRGIYALYETFRRFQKQQTAPGRIPSPKQAWTDLANAILYDSKNNVESSMDRIHDVTTKNNMFQTAKKEIEGDMLCNSQQSPQQVLYNLYSAIALTELKGYSMIQFSYMLLRLYGQGETYEEITQLLQGYVQNEVDLNSEGTCRENCAEYTYTRSHGCFKNLYCRQQRRCNGKIISCKYVDSDMWICPANPFSGRRYEYIEYENGRVLGRKQGCTRGTTKVDSWWRWLFWHCSYCFCLCDEQGSNSDRYFNMRPAIADINNNRVVTGLRFVKHNRILHLQIQEGELLPRGQINIETVHWVPVEDYKITDKKIFNGQDYHTLSWEKRAIDLDNLEADEGCILTEIGSHLNFEIFTTKFDFDSGKLINPSSTSIWKDNPNTDSSISNPRTEVKLGHPDIPTRSPSPSIPTSKTDQYIEFTHSDMDRDAAQTTVPFLDAQSWNRYKHGAGIFHKGRNNFGGFITPKIITYDFSKHLKAAFPDEEHVSINCLPKLAISQLTWDFLVLEDEIWKFIIEYPDKPVNKTNPDLIVLEKFHNFDKAVHKVPNDIEYGLKSPDSSTRRMDYVQYTGWGGLGDSGAWGQKTKSCSFAGAYSWLRGVFWCHYCFCLCDEDGPKSDRYFNLRPVKSDIANNRVVTGMRIIKSNRIIHLQIQEGKLLPNRQIDNSTVRWVPVDNYTLYQKDVKDKIDFYKMDYDRRTIYLDNLKANRTDQVLTDCLSYYSIIRQIKTVKSSQSLSVRFMSTTNGPKFAIELTGFDFNTGILSNETYKLNISSKSRTYLETGGLVSTLTTDNEPVWGNSPFLKFSSSSKKYDVAQTTLPFFDSQPVTSNPPVPLIGAGLCLKRTNYNYGGFIGPKLWTFGFR